MAGHLQQLNVPEESALIEVVEQAREQRAAGAIELASPRGDLGGEPPDAP